MSLLNMWCVCNIKRNHLSLAVLHGFCLKLLSTPFSKLGFLKFLTGLPTYKSYLIKIKKSQLTLDRKEGLKCECLQWAHGLGCWMRMKTFLSQHWNRTSTNRSRWFSTPLHTHTHTLASRFRNNKCKDDSALFSRFLYALFL